MIPNRLKRVAQLLKREISDIIRTEMRNTNVNFVTLTDVEVSPDLRHAKVFVSLLSRGAKREKELEALNNSRGFIRRELGPRIKMRRTPDLHFYFDESMEKAQRINEILNQLPDEDRFAPEENEAAAGFEAAPDATET